MARHWRDVRAGATRHLDAQAIDDARKVIQEETRARRLVDDRRLAVDETAAVLADKALLADHAVGIADIRSGDMLDADALTEYLQSDTPD